MPREKGVGGGEKKVLKKTVTPSKTLAGQGGGQGVLKSYKKSKNTNKPPPKNPHPPPTPPHTPPNNNKRGKGETSGNSELGRERERKTRPCEVRQLIRIVIGKPGNEKRRTGEGEVPNLGTGEMAPEEARCITDSPMNGQEGIGKTGGGKEVPDIHWLLQRPKSDNRLAPRE